MALLAERWHRPHNIPLKRWMLFFGTEIFVHLFLDGFNVYGIGWLEPFSHERFALNTIFVADPFFSFWAGIAFLMLLVLKRHHHHRKFWWRFGIILPSIYLIFCVFNKSTIDADVKTAFAKENILHKEYLTVPTPLNNFLWYIVAENDSGFYIGYRSVFDSKRDIQFQFFPRKESLLRNVTDHEELQRLKRFSRGFYTADDNEDTLVFNDLRFGQIAGWKNAEAPFVFRFYLQHNDNALVVQRGRFAEWNKATIQSLIQRIKGN